MIDIIIWAWDHHRERFEPSYEICLCEPNSLILIIAELRKTIEATQWLQKPRDAMRPIS
jgi:hypothetical protein